MCVCVCVCVWCVTGGVSIIAVVGDDKSDTLQLLSHSRCFSTETQVSCFRSFRLHKNTALASASIDDKLYTHSHFGALYLRPRQFRSKVSKAMLCILKIKTNVSKIMTECEKTFISGKNEEGINKMKI